MAENAVSSSVLGSSPIPTILGYVLGALTIADELFKSNGMPQDRSGWFQLLGGILFGVLGRYTKQSNVTNAPKPVEARTTEESRVTAPTQLPKA